MNRFRGFTEQEIAVIDEALCKLDVSDDEFYSEKDKRKINKTAKALQKEIPKFGRGRCEP